MMYTLTPVTDANSNYKCPASPVAARNWTCHQRHMRSDLSSLSDFQEVKAAVQRELGPYSLQQAHTLLSKKL
jgi:hypothetical protein